MRSRVRGSLIAAGGSRSPSLSLLVRWCRGMRLRRVTRVGLRRPARVRVVVLGSRRLSTRSRRRADRPCHVHVRARTHVTRAYKKFKSARARVGPGGSWAWEPTDQQAPKWITHDLDTVMINELDFKINDLDTDMIHFHHDRRSSHGRP